MAAIDAIKEVSRGQDYRSQVMTREVLTVRPDLPVDRLVEFLTDHSISGAPVVSEQDAYIHGLGQVLRKAGLRTSSPVGMGSGCGERDHGNVPGLR
jgi:CBS domain-containing protein